MNPMASWRPDCSPRTTKKMALTNRKTAEEFMEYQEAAQYVTTITELLSAEALAAKKEKSEEVKDEDEKANAAEEKKADDGIVVAAAKQLARGSKEKVKLIAGRTVRTLVKLFPETPGANAMEQAAHPWLGWVVGWSPAPT